MRAPIDRIDLLLQKQSVRDEGIEVNKVRISRAGAERLIGTVAVAGGADGQNLPVTLSCRMEEIREFIRRLAQGTDAIGRGQRGNVH